MIISYIQSRLFHHLRDHYNFKRIRKLPVGLIAELIRALHRCRRGHGFESRSSLNLFRLFFYHVLKLTSFTLFVCVLFFWFLVYLFASLFTLFIVKEVRHFQHFSVVRVNPRLLFSLDVFVGGFGMFIIQYCYLSFR